MTLHFTKMQALGNDFVVIDAVHQAVSFTPAFIQTLANRRYGVGCDQVLILGTANDARADFSYRIFNADGTEVAQCGNGARCMGLFIQHHQLSDKKTVVLQTQHDLLSVSSCGANEFQVDIAHPKFSPAHIPFLPEQAKTLSPFYVVNVGNPHAVFCVDHIDLHQLEEIGAALQNHPAFPERVNVGFMQILSRKEITLAVFERGAGMTQACGSGACAAVAVGQQQGWLDKTVRVKQAGGLLEVSWSAPDQKIQLRGEANIVFFGDCSF